MKDYKVSESKSLIHLDHGDLAVTSLALGSAMARELSMSSVSANGTELDWKPHLALHRRQPNHSVGTPGL